MVHPPLAATALLLVASPFIGSFLGTLAYRMPRGRSALGGRSACPACGVTLGPADLLPVLGYAWRGGRCGQCGVPISRDYPAIELAALAAAVWAVMVLPGWQGWAVCVLGWFLIALAAIDLRHFLLPDTLTLSLVTLGLALSVLGILAPGLAWPVQPVDAAGGALLGFAVLTVVGMVYRGLRGRSGIGLGDAKLLAAAGAWAGWQGLPGVVLIAALSALAFAGARGAWTRRLPRSGDPVPFGPYLALGTWLVVLYGPMAFGF